MGTDDQTTTQADVGRREAAVRRALRPEGQALRKSRARNWTLDNQGGYMIVDADRNFIVAGEKYDLTLDDVERWVAAG